ncbi:MAG TPA: hypothetical protein VF796_26300, partial [Humisphaera sp.]
VTNLGAGPTPAGTVAFANGSGTLAVQGAAQQPLPALAAGASASVAWQVVGVAPADPSVGSTYQLTATTGELVAVLTGEVTVS